MARYWTADSDFDHYDEMRPKRHQSTEPLNWEPFNLGFEEGKNDALRILMDFWERSGDISAVELVDGVKKEIEAKAPF